MRSNAFPVAAVLGLLIVAARPAHAGCPSSSSDGCLVPRDVTHTLTPSMSCLQLRQELNDCVCAVDVWVKNACADPLEAQEFTWGSINPYIQGHALDSIPPDHEGSVEIRADADDTEGPGQQVYRFMVGTQEVTLTLTYNLEHYATGTGCGVGSAATSGGWPLLLLVLLLIWCHLRRASKGIPGGGR